MTISHINNTCKAEKKREKGKKKERKRVSERERILQEKIFHTNIKEIEKHPPLSLSLGNLIFVSSSPPNFPHCPGYFFFKQVSKGRGFRTERSLVYRTGILDFEIWPISRIVESLYR